MTRVLCWGTYDLGKPRIRIMLRGLRENNIILQECHTDVWAGVEDKSQVGGLISRSGLMLRWLLSYPGLIVRYLRAGRHDAVYVGYLGQLDVLVLWPFARLRGAKIVWDAFLSLYEMVVEDRKMIRRSNLLAKILFAWEWLACRAADRIVLDTDAHAEYFARAYSLPQEKLASVFVGVEPETFPSQAISEKRDDPDAPFSVLFFGQFIPLHGIETIVQAAQRSKDSVIHWIIIGKGQQAEDIQHLLDERPMENLSWIPWVPYPELIKRIHAADVCLGIFGKTAKAARVIPNKVFQILSAGRPLITMDSPAIRELLDPDMPGITLVPPGNPEALLEAVNEAKAQQGAFIGKDLHSEIQQCINPLAIGSRMVEIVRETVSGRG